MPVWGPSLHSTPIRIHLSISSSLRIPGMGLDGPRCHGGPRGPSDQGQPGVGQAQVCPLRWLAAQGADCIPITHRRSQARPWSDCWALKSCPPL